MNKDRWTERLRRRGVARHAAALSDEVVEGVSERTGGVPLFIEEVALIGKGHEFVCLSQQLVQVASKRFTCQHPC